MQLARYRNLHFLKLNCLILTMPAADKKSNLANLWTYCIFLLASLLLFSPVLNKNFASDDFAVLYRLVYQHKIFIREFFRPLSDITLYLSYLMGGFDPLYFNVFNVIIHGSCAYMLYRFCSMRQVLPVENRTFFAWSAAILFLIYPYHNESVVWVVGRASMMACFFGFLSLLIAFSEMPASRKYLLSCLCYFIGLCGYETILPLPGIVLFLLYRKGMPLKNLFVIAAGYSATLILNMIVRYQVSGGLLGSYGSKLFSPNWSDYISKILKTAGRLFLPPSTHSILLIVGFLIVFFIIVTISFICIKRRNSDSGTYFIITGSLCLACIVPFMFGINTRTFEGDRVFYFASFFLCIWAGFIFQLIKRAKIRLAAVFLAGAYCLYFFYQSIDSWRTAGKITTTILQQTGNLKPTGKHLMLINLPEEFNGAQVFRNGFQEALLINHIDTTGLIVINYLASEDAEKINGIIQPVFKGDSILLPPYSAIYKGIISSRQWANTGDTIYYHSSTSDKIYYWNKKAFLPVNKPF